MSRIRIDEIQPSVPADSDQVLVRRGSEPYEMALVRHDKRVTPFDFGAKGDGVTDDRPAFAAMDAYGGEAYIPKPPVRYVFSSPLTMANVSLTIDPALEWGDLTDGGNLRFFKGRAYDLPTGANIHRVTDRLFVGGAAERYAGNGAGLPDAGSSWLKTAADGPAYLAVNAGVLFINGGAPADDTRNIPYGFVTGLKASVAGQGIIGFGSAIVADRAATSAWGFIAELQREAGAGQVYGMEVGAKNKGADATMTPNAQVSGVFGLWLAGGGDDAFGGAPVNPSTAGVVLLKNKHTWNTGIVFMRDALTTGEAVALSSEGVGGAHRLSWYNAAGAVQFFINSQASDGEPWRMSHENNAIRIYDNGANTFSFGGAASAVNGFTFFAGATGSPSQIAAAGSDANIDFQISTKGTGRVRFGTFTGSGDVPITGSIEIRDAGGTIRKLAVVA